VVQAGNILTIQTDHLDTPRQLTDNTKKVVWNWAYSAFGENQPTNINNTVFNLRYPGQYYDAESKLHYNINRYYDPATGRYTQSDPIGLAGGINTYTYVGGNSIRWIDPWGLERFYGEDRANSYLSKHNFNSEAAAMDIRSHRYTYPGLREVYSNAIQLLAKNMVNTLLLIRYLGF
jgi:RHS repeat-associated protein